MSRLEETINWRKMGNYDIALLMANSLLAARPGESSVHHTLGQIHTELGAFDKALDSFALAVDIIKRKRGPLAVQSKAFQVSSLGLAQSLMRFGRFEGVWPMWEAGRLEASWSPWPGSVYWDGSDPAPETLLVQAEGGYGDVFMMLRWLPLLKLIKGVQTVGLTLFPSLAGFCDWQALGVDKVYRVGIDMLPFGCWKAACSIMSMPAVFGVMSYSDIPPHGLEGHQLAILKPPTRIGFCWRAEENLALTKTKSLPMAVAQAVTNRLMSDDETCGVFSLSPHDKDLYGDGTPTQPQSINYEAHRMASWRDTAEYIASMDFIVSVDTAVLHLSGLLGVPALGLLPCSSCWRWGLPYRKSGPWYGEQMTYYRQPVPLKWDADGIIAAVKERIGAKAWTI